MSSEYNRKLKALINQEFIHRVIPENLLPAIKKYDSNVLTDRDMDRIKARTETAGKIVGAEELLDLMSRYDGWFPCLMQALKDPSVKLETLAVRFEHQKATLDRQEASMQEMFEERQPQNDFRIDSDGTEASREERERNTGLVSNDFQPDGPCDEEPKYETVDVRGESQPNGAGRPTSHEYGEYVARIPSPYLEPSNETSGRLARERERQQGQVHGPEYDFTFEETRAELSMFPGWDHSVQESEIKDILEPCLEEDGRYVLWYWTELKRPAISAIYNGEVKNFIVHKKPRKSIPGVVKYYFINKSQHCDQSMTRLMQFHFNQGIQNTEQGNHHQFIHLRQQVGL